MIGVPMWLAEDESVARIAWQSFSYYPQLSRVRQYVQDHIGERITLRDAAGIACLEPKYFSSFFRSKAKITFSEWLRLVRVMRSAELFRFRDISVSQAAREVGFRSLRTFERAFRRVIGMSPVQFKWCVRPENRAIRKFDSPLTMNVANSTTPHVA